MEDIVKIYCHTCGDEYAHPTEDFLAGCEQVCPACEDIQLKADAAREPIFEMLPGWWLEEVFEGDL